MPKTQSHSRTRKRRVVIIDDDPDFGELLTALVGGLGNDAVVKAD